MASTKKSNFVADTAIPDGSTLDFVVNGQNFKITKANFLAALGVTGTLSQAGPVTGTPVLDSSGTDYLVRNLESLDGISLAVSAENGLSIGANLVAGENVSIVSSGAGGLVVAASVGSVANTVVVQVKADFPTPVSSVITLAVATYVIKGNINLGGDTISMPGGSEIVGDTATLSSLTSSSSSPTILVSNGGFAACSISGTGGLKINNTGGGAAIRVQDTNTLCSIRRLFTSECTTGLEINDGSVLLDSWTLLGSVVNGLVMTGTGNTGPILNNFNPLGCTGRGIYIDGDITSSALRINNAIVGSTALPCIGNAIEIATNRTIQGMSLSGDAVSSGGNGLRVAGTISGGILIENTNILSLTAEGMDVTGGIISTMIGTGAGITAIGAGVSALKGNAQSDTTILAGGGNISAGGSALFNVCQINNPIDPTAAPLSGIAKTDIQYDFKSAGVRITDSTNIGGFTLDAQATTTINFQGFDGSNTAYSDSATSPGVKTTVTSAGHSVVNGAPVSIVGTTSYNRLFTASNILTNSYDIDIAFVANDATGAYQTGWTKIAGSTTEIETIERFSGATDNQLELLDPKTLPVTYSATISGEKSGSPARICQFALFVDSGAGFMKVDGEATIDIINRIKSTTLRVPFEMSSGALATIYCRNLEGTDDFICDALVVDIGLS